MKIQLSGAAFYYRQIVPNHANRRLAAIVLCGVVGGLVGTASGLSVYALVIGWMVGFGAAVIAFCGRAPLGPFGVLGAALALLLVFEVLDAGRPAIVVALVALLGTVFIDYGGRIDRMLARPYPLPERATPPVDHGGELLGADGVPRLGGVG